jgi:hypothetical protein
MFRKYWGVVLLRAWRTTRHDFRLETNPRILVAILIWGTVLFLAFESNPKEFSFAQNTQNTAKWLAAISLIFPIWFVGRIFVSSAEIYWELVEKIGNLEKEKNNKEVIKNTLNDLADISYELKRLFDKAIASDVELETLRSNVSSEIQKACTVIQLGISKSSAKTFAIMPTVVDGIFRGSYNQEHNFIRLIISKRIEQLSEIIAQHDAP